MKLSDLSRVGELKSSLDYLDSVRRILNGRRQVRLSLTGDDNALDLRPKIVGKCVNAIEAAVLEERSATIAALAELGVTVE